MGHMNMARIQSLAKQGFFGSAHVKLSTCDPPLCKACLNREQHKRPLSPSTFHPIDASHLLPGDCVSGDQLESTHPGMVPAYKGIPTKATYHTGTLLVDHASRYLHFTLHHSTGVTEAITAKNSLVLLASSFNRSIKQYHTDNYIFSSKPFKDSCLQQKQKPTFCGINAHHQNGIAGRYIRSITKSARTMLINAMLSWPGIIHENLWPFAVQLAVDLHNNTPTSAGLSPIKIFSGSKQSTPSSAFHPFGCPIYVLKSTLHQNLKIPRWKPRSRVGVYVGFSPHHASSVPLILSTTKGLISPQFHVVFDDNFSTTQCLHSNTIKTNWPELFSTSAISNIDDDFTLTNLYDSS